MNLKTRVYGILQPPSKKQFCSLLEALPNETLTFKVWGAQPWPGAHVEKIKQLCFHGGVAHRYQLVHPDEETVRDGKGRAD